MICFAGSTKRGTLPITSGPARKLRKAVSGLARLAYDGKTLLVPGLPEARNWDERSAALRRFQAEIEKRLGDPALARAIEMLNDIGRGKQFTRTEFYTRLTSYERARDAHHEQLLKDERNRAQLRELSRQLRGAGASENHTITAPAEACNSHSLALDGTVIGEVKP